MDSDGDRSFNGIMKVDGAEPNGGLGSAIGKKDSLLDIDKFASRVHVLRCRLGGVGKGSKAMFVVTSCVSREGECIRC